MLIDEYSVGVVMYYLLTKQYPFKVDKDNHKKTYHTLMTSDIPFEEALFSKFAHAAEIK